MRTALLRNAFLGVLMLGFTVGAQAGPKGDSIVDVAIAANGPSGAYENQLNTLIAALQAADPSILETLSGNGQHTVFAPTDAAFAALGLNADNIGSAFPQSALSDILLIASFWLTRRIWFVWGIHFGWNFFQDGIFGMPNSGETQFPSWLTSTVDGPHWLTGGEFGIEASVVSVAVNVIVGAAILLLAVRLEQIVRPSWSRSRGARQSATS